MPRAKRTTPDQPTAKPARKRAKAVVPAPAPASVQALPKGKLGVLVGLLARSQGASIDDMMQASGWQAHSVRGAIAGAIKKKLGHTVTSTKTDGARVYRMVQEARP